MKKNSEEYLARRRKKVLEGIENLKKLVDEEKQKGVVGGVRPPETTTAPPVSETPPGADVPVVALPKIAKELTEANLKALRAEADAAAIARRATTKKDKPRKVKKTNKKEKGQGKAKKNKDWDEGIE